MKKLTTLLIIIFSGTIMSYGQSKLPVDSTTGKVVFREIIELDTTYNADKIFSIVKEWLSTNTKFFNRSNSDKNYETADMLFGNRKGNSTQLDQLYKIDQPLKFQDAIEKKLIGKSVLKYTGGSMGCFRILYLEYDIKVFIKNYKLKVDITNLNYTHYNQASMKQSQMYGFNDTGTCNSKNTIENLLKCNHCSGEYDKFYSFLTADMNILTTDLKTFLQTSKKSDNNW